MYYYCTSEECDEIEATGKICCEELDEDDDSESENGSTCYRLLDIQCDTEIFNFEKKSKSRTVPKKPQVGTPWSQIVSTIRYKKLEQDGNVSSRRYI